MYKSPIRLMVTKGFESYQLAQCQLERCKTSNQVQVVKGNKNIPLDSSSSQLRQGFGVQGDRC